MSESFKEKKVRGDDPIECFLSTGVGSTFRVPEGVMAIEVPQNKDICREGKNGGRKGVSCAILQSRANRGNINIKK